MTPHDVQRTRRHRQPHRPCDRGVDPPRRERRVPRRAPACPTELELAARFGVSRTVVREAVARLKSAGLVESRQGSGALRPRAEHRHALPARPADAARLGGFGPRDRRGPPRHRGGDGRPRRGAPHPRAARRHPQGARGHRRARRRPGGDGVAGGHGASTAPSPAPRATATSSRSGTSSASSSGWRCAATRANEARRADFADQVHAEHRAIVDAIARGDGPAARAAALRHMDMAEARIALRSEFWTGTAADAEEPAARPRRRKPLPAPLRGAREIRDNSLAAPRRGAREIRTDGDDRARSERWRRSIRMKVGVIGLGSMGLGVARSLLRAGPRGARLRRTAGGARGAARGGRHVAGDHAGRAGRRGWRRWWCSS